MDSLKQSCIVAFVVAMFAVGGIASAADEGGKAPPPATESAKAQCINMLSALLAYHAAIVRFEEACKYAPSPGCRQQAADNREDLADAVRQFVDRCL